MKSIIAALFLAISLPALACQAEAQFIGNVISYKKDCTYQIDFSRFDQSIVCPLDEWEASEAVFHDLSCSMKDGDLVSGYLIKTADEDIIIDN